MMLMFHISFMSNILRIFVESYDSKRFALELSTARQTWFVHQIFGSFGG